MTQDNGFREKVKEVLHDVWIDKLTQDEATDRIVSLVRELIPTDDGSVRKTDDYSDGWLGGYEACRTEILSRLEEGK